MEKGVIETIPGFIYIIIAIAIGIFLFSLLHSYSDLFVKKDVVLKGDKYYIAQKIADKIKECWEEHRGGMDSVSGICTKITLYFPENLTEKDVVKYIDCQSLPDINCSPENCSYCTSDYFYDQDKIKWFVKNKKKDKRISIEISYSGSERAIKVSEMLTEEICDPYDRVCDEKCSYVGGVCDRYCYLDNKSEEVPCDYDCVDYDKNGIINISDRDGVCDLDCYNNITDPQNAYDIDCIWENREISDGICDPDTQGKSDGVCDPDCAKPNYICDFDCNGSVYEGNPKGLNDPDCSTCDKICNGVCLPLCKPKEDPDCPDGFKGSSNLTECCGNKKCGAKEDCETCPEDCPGGETCEDLDKVCCPSSQDSDEYGCSAKKNLNETEACICDSQCKDGLTCSHGHCCPVGENWNGTACIKQICNYPCTPNCTIPDKFDWSHVILPDAPPYDGKNWMTPVKDQHVPGWCGSCWAFSAVAAIEGTYKIERRNSSADIDLSEQYLVSCTNSGSCNGGTYLAALQHIHTNGIVDEDCFPYKGCKYPVKMGSVYKCQQEYTCTLCSNWKKRLWKIGTYERVMEDVNSIKRAVVCHGPLSAYVRSLPHAVTLVGYDDSKKQWIIKNSWGVFTGWVPFIPGGWRYHIKGYFRTPYSDIGGLYYVKNVKAP